ncbi:MAG: ABC transporter permease [Bryobacterales bacterium]|nr:ABC transporter permease [Bryobacterales bacterium]
MALWNELRIAARTLWKDRRFAATVTLTLALCIAANSSVFTIVYSVLLRPLPVAAPQELVLLSNQYPKAGVGESTNSAAGDYFDRKGRVAALSHHALFGASSQVIQQDEGPTPIPGMAVTPSLFPLLRVRPALGRAFDEADAEIGNQRKVILSHGLWQKLFAGRADAIGKQVRLSGNAYTVTGVMPAGFLFYDPQVRYWIPLAFSAEEKQARHNNNYHYVGRLAAGATPAQVAGQVASINRSLLDLYPNFKEALINAGFYTRVDRLQELMVKDVRDTLYLLWGGALFVLLIGAVNIANLSLARMNQRRKETGTRIALGAGHWHVARQLIVENALLALAGGTLGLALARAAMDGLSRFGLDSFPRAAEVRIDLPVAVYSLAIALGIGLLVGLLPSAGVFRASLASVMQDASRGGTSGRRSKLVRQWLVVAQVAVAFMLLAGSGVLLASFRNLLTADPGFRAGGVWTVSTRAIQASRQGEAALRGFMQRALEAIRAIPGVRTAGATSHIPLGGDYSDSVTLAEGYTMQPGESVITPYQIAITPGYMEAMGMKLLRGRLLSGEDSKESRPVIVIDQRLARKFWPNQDTIGRRMFRPESPDLRPVANQRWLTVVGVVRDSKLTSLEGNGNQSGTVYSAYTQSPRASITFAINAPGLGGTFPADLRRALASVDASLALFDIRTMEDRSRLSLASRRMALTLAMGFGILALVLSSVGVFGVLSYLLSQRRREIGIRLAVGSTAAGVFRLFLREGLLLIAVGLAIGLLGAVALERVVATQVYGMSALDPAVLALAALLLGGAALFACLWPARRAMAVDPVTVLQE